MDRSELRDRLQEWSEDENFPVVVASTVEELKQNSTLTDRQSEVVGMKEHGLRNSQIAEVLDISGYTVQEHVRQANRRIARAEYTAEQLGDD